MILKFSILMNFNRFSSNKKTFAYKYVKYYQQQVAQPAQLTYTSQQLAYAHQPQVYSAAPAAQVYSAAPAAKSISGNGQAVAKAAVVAQPQAVSLFSV